LLKNTYQVVSVVWKKMELLGLADIEMNVIYLNRKIPLDASSFGVGGGATYESGKSIQFEEGEQYFLVLLHEIAHFKVIKRPSKEFLSIKSRLEQEYPGNLQKQIEIADIYIKPRKNESSEDTEGRILDLRTWLEGLSASEHIMVGKWAIREFQKNRKKIRTMLN